MQINTRAAYIAATDRMSSLSAELDQVQAQIASGKRIIAPDDDPIGAARVTQLHRALATDAATPIGSTNRAAKRSKARFRMVIAE